MEDKEIDPGTAELLLERHKTKLYDELRRYLEQAPKAPDAPAIMDVDQAAAYLGFSSRTVYNMAHAGEMPAAKIKGSWRFSKAALDSWVAELSRVNMKLPWPFDENKDQDK
jgi:excisionase family DNA binding protein